ncbi:hypothetical protein VTI74DRAFT_5683 [Chaetomium olivicolor]
MSRATSMKATGANLQKFKIVALARQSPANRPSHASRGLSEAQGNGDQVFDPCLLRKRMRPVTWAPGALEPPRIEPFIRPRLQDGTHRTCRGARGPTGQAQLLSRSLEHASTNLEKPQCCHFSRAPHPLHRSIRACPSLILPSALWRSQSGVAEWAHERSRWIAEPATTRGNGRRRDLGQVGAQRDQ